MSHGGTRDYVAALFNKQPGLTIQELADAADIGHSTAAYHTRRLAAEGILVEVPGTKREKRFAPNNATAVHDYRVRAVSSRRTTARLLDFADRYHGIRFAQSRVAAGLGVSNPTLVWHSSFLDRLGLAHQEKLAFKRDSFRYYVTADGHHVAEDLRRNYTAVLTPPLEMTQL